MREYMEPRENEVTPPTEEQKLLLRSLANADESDKFLHNKFIGAKRFSVSGAESVIVLLRTLLEEAGEHSVTEVLMGMAHRGRLAVMMNVMGQSATEIFSRFAGGDPYANIGSGDVKYHLGCYRNFVTASGKEMYVALAFNPSHLEAISPVIAGRVRASQDRLADDETNSVLGVTLHGDAAVMGQGVYAETLNLSRLEGYKPTAARSGSSSTTRSASPPTPATAVRRSTRPPSPTCSTCRCSTSTATTPRPPPTSPASRSRFASSSSATSSSTWSATDASDTTRATSPRSPSRRCTRSSRSTPRSATSTSKRLLERGTVSQASTSMASPRSSTTHFEESLDEVRKTTPSNGRSPMHGRLDRTTRADPTPRSRRHETNISPNSRTRSPRSRLVESRTDSTSTPSSSASSASSARCWRAEAPLSWAACEHLAYGSLLQRRAPRCVSGQDCIRGTFTHRHLGWTDTETGQRYFPLPPAESDHRQTSGAHNSPLSEFAVVGFEFGYSLAAPESLLIWEAQFGDFANGAQVIIDQFISAAPRTSGTGSAGSPCFFPTATRARDPSTPARGSSGSCSCAPKTTCRSAT